MPIYESRCLECGEVTEHLLRDPSLIPDCQCGGKVERLYSAPSLFWSTGKHTISFEARRTFTQPHKMNDSRQRDYYFQEA